MLSTLTKPKLLTKKKTLSPYFSHFRKSQYSQKPQKLDVMQGINERQNEVYNYTVNFGAKQITQQDANFWGFKIQYLRPWIQEAKRRTGMDKVDIIAHSMGGLVTRSYIQSNKYQNDIRNFTMVGTPNKGASRVYYLYNGDPVLADVVAGKDGVLGPLGINDYIYTRTIMNLHDTRGSGSSLCFEVWGKSYDPRLKEKVELFCNQEKTADFIRKNGQGLLDLMPTYTFLQNENNEDIELTEGTNEFLLALNNGGTYRGETYSLPQSIKTKVNRFEIFGGDIAHSTLNKIKVETNTNTQSPVHIYKDGIPIIYTEQQYDNQKEIGDTTVLITSLFPSFFNLDQNNLYLKGHGQSLNNKKKWKYKHGKLIKDFTNGFTKNSLNFVQYITR